jgi:hypothetical protein
MKGHAENAADVDQMADRKAGGRISATTPGLVATLIAALIGGLMGAVVSGAFALANTNRQIGGESERSRAEFLRSQRQESYGQFINDMNMLSVAEQRLRTAIEGAIGNQKRATEDATVSQALAAVKDAQIAAQRDYAEIRVVGSQDATDAFGAQFLRDHELYVDDMMSATDLATLRQSYEYGEQEFASRLESFLVVARRDLGAE